MELFWIGLSVGLFVGLVGVVIAIIKLPEGNSDQHYSVAASSDDTPINVIVRDDRPMSVRSEIGDIELGIDGPQPRQHRSDN